MKLKLHDWQKGLSEELAFSDETDYEIMRQAQIHKGLRKLSSRDWEDIRGMPLSKPRAKPVLLRDFEYFDVDANEWIPVKATKRLAVNQTGGK
jgi:hypothetical protein